MPIIDFRGPKKPPMPQNISKRTVLPLRILAQQSILVRRATHLDFEFLDSVTNDSKVPAYAGFNTRMSREENHSLKPGTSVANSPLIDMVPSDPSTIKTATVFEPGRDFATLSRFLFECRTKINHPRHHVATKYEMSRV